MEDIKEYSGTIGLSSSVTITPEWPNFSCANIQNNSTVNIVAYVDNRNTSYITVEPGDYIPWTIAGRSLTIANSGSAAVAPYKVWLEYRSAVII
jgi:hypothetical protein